MTQTLQSDEQLWKVFDRTGKTYGEFDRRTAWETVERVQRENPELKSVGMCLAEMDPLPVPAWFDRSPEDL